MCFLQKDTISNEEFLLKEDLRIAERNNAVCAISNSLGANSVIITADRFIFGWVLTR